MVAASSSHPGGVNCPVHGRLGPVHQELGQLPALVRHRHRRRRRSRQRRCVLIIRHGQERLIVCFHPAASSRLHGPSAVDCLLGRRRLRSIHEQCAFSHVLVAIADFSRELAEAGRPKVSDESRLKRVAGAAIVIAVLAFIFWYFFCSIRWARLIPPIPPATTAARCGSPRIISNAGRAIGGPPCSLRGP